MADANPRCARCNRPLVWIGIGPGAEAVCTYCTRPHLPEPATPRPQKLDFDLDKWEEETEPLWPQKKP